LRENEIVTLKKSRVWGIEIIEITEFIYSGSTCIAMTDSVTVWLWPIRPTPAPYHYSTSDKRGAAALVPHEGAQSVYNRK
jgi:hypothetical protein